MVHLRAVSPNLTGAKFYLHLKSGDSYTRKRRNDGAEIFTLKKQRHAEY